MFKEGSSSHRYHSSLRLLYYTTALYYCTTVHRAHRKNKDIKHCMQHTWINRNVVITSRTETLVLYTNQWDGGVSKHCTKITTTVSICTTEQGICWWQRFVSVCVIRWVADCMVVGTIGSVHIRQVAMQKGFQWVCHYIGSTKQWYIHCTACTSQCHTFRVSTYTYRYASAYTP